MSKNAAIIFQKDLVFTDSVAVVHSPKPSNKCAAEVKVSLVTYKSNVWAAFGQIFSLLGRVVLPRQVLKENSEI